MRKQKRSPAADGARGASEADQLGGRVVSDHSLSQNSGQATLAELIGSHTCIAEGFEVRGAAPVLAMCRRLIDAGHDPNRPLRAYRGDVFCLGVRRIGDGARLTVKTAGNGAPVFAPYGLTEGAGGSLTRGNASTQVRRPQCAKRS